MREITEPFSTSFNPEGDNLQANISRYHIIHKTLFILKKSLRLPISFIFNLQSVAFGARHIFING